MFPPSVPHSDKSGHSFDVDKRGQPDAVDLNVSLHIERPSEKSNEKEVRLDQEPVISVVVPAYNEENRMSSVLEENLKFLRSRGEAFEIIVVNDGSVDGTAKLVESLLPDNPELKLINHDGNQGKGIAVRTGMREAKGQYRLFADADGSTSIQEMDRLLKELKEGAQVAIGSRALASTETSISTKWYRKLPGRMFAFCVNRFLIKGIKDTQCGFKMFTAEAADFIFKHQEQPGWSVDLELLHLANKAGMSVKEVPVNWKHMPGSKINVIRDGLKMVADIFAIRWRHRKLKVDKNQMAHPKV
jgi:dolichyl-phosphate beta-glucosyltransferase